MTEAFDAAFDLPRTLPCEWPPASGLPKGGFLVTVAGTAPVSHRTSLISKRHVWLAVEQ